MIIYNVTVNVESEIHEAWLAWMKQTHLPKIMSTGYFCENKFCKVLSTQEGEVGVTYAIQYFCKKIEDLEVFQEKYATRLEQEHLQQYKGKIVAFTTLLEVVD